MNSVESGILDMALKKHEIGDTLGALKIAAGRDVREGDNFIMYATAEMGYKGVPAEDFYRKLITG